MRKEIADKWVAALRSGKYPQGQEWLRNEIGKFCCLGVLCDISGIGEWDGPAYRHLDKHGEEFASTMYLSPTIMEWAGMESWSGIIPGEMPLAVRNDQGDSFDTIADVIEANWEVL